MPVQLNAIATLPLSPTRSPGPGATVGSGGFTEVLGQWLDQVNQQQAQANAAVRDLALGKTDQMHHVLLDIAKADLAFRLTLEIRNRLVDAYQEVMKMQV